MTIPLRLLVARRLGQAWFWRELALAYRACRFLCAEFGTGRCCNLIGAHLAARKAGFWTLGCFSPRRIMLLASGAFCGPRTGRLNLGWRIWWPRVGADGDLDRPPLASGRSRGWLLMLALGSKYQARTESRFRVLVIHAATRGALALGHLAAGVLAGWWPWGWSAWPRADLESGQCWASFSFHGQPHGRGVSLQTGEISAAMFGRGN